MSLVVVIIILVLCLLLEGFFSGSEIAVVNADKYRLALATDAGSKRARSVLHLAKHPAVFFSTTLLGTNLSAITATVVATFFIIDRFGEAYAPLAILYWPMALVFGEIVPKAVYQHHADRIVLRVAPLLLGVSFALYPAVWLFSKLTDVLLGGVKRRAELGHPITRDELELMIEVGGAGTSDVRPAERTLISRLFDLADKRVEQIMTPLVDVVSVPVGATHEEACGVMDLHGFSRVPVIDGDAFNVVGVLTGIDLLFGGKGKGVRELMHKAYFVPEEMSLDELLIEMKRKGVPLAVAVDEYGAATGIVTVEDLLEEVVGEIRDEHDEVPEHYTRTGRFRYLLSGRLEVSHANERLKLGIPAGPYQTVAGFVIHELERIPKAGESFRSGRFEYRVSRATDRAVLEVEAWRTADKAEGEKIL
ncbi:MAG: HlyC/CorC family transporter [Proteobacteria bacterium]|nr:HlyC/CorC family transporter [Pseudomonadota bacterium]